MRYLILIVLPLLLLSCHGNKNSLLVPLITFNLQPGALVTGDSVKLLYCSNAQKSSDTIRFLIQFVAIKLSTGDTVNILSTHNDGIARDDGGKTFYFTPMDKLSLDQIIGSDSAFLEVTRDGATLKNLRAGQKTIKVIQDPRDTRLSINRNATVFGEVTPGARYQVFSIEE
ncbi:MAG: hypothetical protein EOP49_15345 [Sphingobacteriales bacterium]|nr:MAG: hypothetical protein EOP49_15345 [Sphingobacteriales bacterium]